MTDNHDQAPVGIPFCTRKDPVLVEYALAGLGNNIFISLYQLELPDKDRLQAFIEGHLREVKGKKAEQR